MPETSSGEVYYRLYVDEHNYPIAVCSRNFALVEDQSRFINDGQYASNKEAQERLIALKMQPGALRAFTVDDWRWIDRITPQEAKK